MDETLTAARDARAAGRHDEALRLLVALFEAVRDDPPRFAEVEFILVLEWAMLVRVYSPARAALGRLRDERARHLLASADGPLDFKARRRGGFALIAEMNNTLLDPAATYALFVRMLEVMPQRAQQEAYLALPAILAAGDFALAERYLRDPLARLAELNRSADNLPLFPEGRAAPRLAAELAILIEDVRQNCAVLEGTGREALAQALRDAALDGIASLELRDWGRRELAQPGAIRREINARTESYDQTGQS